MAEYVRLRAPKEHGESLQLPPISDGSSLVDSNREQLASYPADLQAIRLLARKEIRELAVHYSAQYLESVPDLNRNLDSIVMSGHQPTMFHPGVWFKNFALNSIAKRAGATAINLVVDNDLCDHVQISLPLSTAGRHVAFDVAAPPMPYEVRQIVDEGEFRSFADRVESARRIPMGIDVSQGNSSGTGRSFRPDSSMIHQLWAEVVEASSQLSSLPAALAAGRHRLEWKHGLTNLEVPISLLSSSESFARFVEMLILDSARFRTIYNEELALFRKVNRIRSRSHPVPELEAADEYSELPFWIWTTSKPARRRLFAKLSAQRVELTDRINWSVEIDRSNLAADLQCLNQLNSHVFIRPRALTTTMFCRLFASDLFIHGIGGAKYDQLGDEIARRLFDIKPPKYMTVSATMCLPDCGVTTKAVTDRIANLKAALRRLRYHPELELQNDPRAEKKLRLIRNQPESGSRKKWHDEIALLNESMFANLDAKREELEADLSEANDALPLAKLIGSREFSFALFPIELIHQLKDMAG